MNKLTFEQLRITNADRCNLWHDGFPDDSGWSVSDWSNAMGGEIGEVAEAVEILVLDQMLSGVGGKVLDTVKKIRRDDDGLSGNKKTREELLSDVANEIADVICYADLLACKLGIDLGAAVTSKFNEVSVRQGFPHRLPSKQSS